MQHQLLLYNQPRRASLQVGRADDNRSARANQPINQSNPVFPQGTGATFRKIPNDMSLFQCESASVVLKGEVEATADKSLEGSWHKLF